MSPVAIRQKETTPEKAHLTDVALAGFSLLWSYMIPPTNPPLPYLSERDRDGCNGALQTLGASCTEIVVPKHDAAMALALLDGSAYHYNTRRSRPWSRGRSWGGGGAAWRHGGCRRRRDCFNLTPFRCEDNVDTVVGKSFTLPEHCRIKARWGLPEPIRYSFKALPSTHRHPLAFDSIHFGVFVSFIRAMPVSNVVRPGRFPPSVRAWVELEGSVDHRYRQELFLGAAHKKVPPRALRSLHPPASTNGRLCLRRCAKYAHVNEYD